MNQFPYLLRVWGRDEDQIVALRKPDLRERGGDGPLCYWFAAAEERTAFEATWPPHIHVMHDRINPGSDGKEFLDTRANTIAHVVLKFPDGRRIALDYPFGYGYPAHSAEFMWEDGNYSCDCNRRLFRWRQEGKSEDDIDARDNPCGDTIQLVSLAITKEPLPGVN